MFAQNDGGAPRTREMQETINHLVLGMTMWVSVTVTCITTLLTVNQPWCLLSLLIPFCYTMFPQIQKATANARDNAIAKLKHKELKEEVLAVPVIAPTSVTQPNPRKQRTRRTKVEMLAMRDGVQTKQTDLLLDLGELDKDIIQEVIENAG